MKTFEQIKQVEWGSESENGDAFAPFMCNSATGAIGAIWLTTPPAVILCMIANKYFDSGWIGNAVIATSFAVLFVKITLVKKSV